MTAAGEIDEDLHSRQLAVYGRESMKRSRGPPSSSAASRVWAPRSVRDPAAPAPILSARTQTGADSSVPPRGLSEPDLAIGDPNARPDPSEFPNPTPRTRRR